MKIAFLIPSTTKDRNWNKMEDTYIYNVFGKSLLNTLSDNNKIQYSAYIFIDKDDKIYSKENELAKLRQLIEPRISIKIIHSDTIEKGHLTKMWNLLFSKAYNDGNDYFYQCGDDIYFENKNWIEVCIEILQEQNNIGICGPTNPPNEKILTQTFVSRKHMEIFGGYFPNQIKNWFCDDWINQVYYPTYVKGLPKLVARNIGGNPRYRLPDKNEFYKIKHQTNKLTILGRQILSKYLDRV